MHFSNVETFIAIVESGNLNRAATRLNVTQSTVTARLNTLEQLLGQPLFHRRKSGAELTSAGFRFERYARLMTDVWRQARQETALPDAIGSVCNLGCHPDMWQTHGNQLFGWIQELQSNIACSAWPGEQGQLNQWMTNGLIDISICYSPTVDEKWQAYQIGTERLVQVSRVKRSKVRSDPEYIYVDYGERFRQDHAAVYSDTDTPRLTMGSAEWALSYLLEHGGSAYLPENRVSELISREQLFIVKETEVFSRYCYMVVNHGSAVDWPWFKQILSRLP